MPGPSSTFRAPAALGDAQALHNMGVLYENGYHVVQDLTTALLFYDAAFSAGHSRAAWHLSALIATPGNYWSDPVEALALCHWSARALEVERAEIEAQCAVLAEPLSEDQRAAAKVRAGEF